MKQVRLDTRGVWDRRNQVKKSISRGRVWLVNWVTDMKNEDRPPGMARSMPLAASIRPAPRVEWGQKPDWMGSSRKREKIQSWQVDSFAVFVGGRGFAIKRRRKVKQGLEAIMESRQYYYYSLSPICTLMKLVCRE